MQKIRLNSEINSAMRKKTSSYLTTDVLNKSFKSTIKHLIELDKAYSLVDSIIGRPVYWKKTSRGSFCDGKTVRYSNVFYGIIMCRFEIKLINFDKNAEIFKCFNGRY